MPRKPIEDARPRLLASGLSLFAKLGCERVNTNSIARRAGVGVGTFYTYFEDKYELLQEIQVRTLEGLRDARKRAIARAGSAPGDQARATIDAAVEFARRHPEAYRVTHGRERISSPRHRPVVSESTRPTADALRRLQKAGRLDPNLDPELAARAYAAMEVGTLLWWIDDPKRSEAGALVDTLLRLHPSQAALPPITGAGSRQAGEANRPGTRAARI